MSLNPSSNAHNRQSQHHQLVLLLVEADAELAAEHRDTLLKAGIEVQLHIENSSYFSATSSVYPTGFPFVYALFVTKADQERAAEKLFEAGWDGKRSAFRNRKIWAEVGFALRGMLLPLLVVALTVTALLLLHSS
jgi:hypothetical protein